MSRDACRYPSCDREPGQQDRDDYRRRSFCSVECDVKHEHIAADAPEPDLEPHHDDVPRHDRAGRMR